MTLILGRKLGMTQLFAEDGTVTGVTVVAAGPCVVTQVRTKDKEGYDAVQLGFEDIADKRCPKPQLGAYRKLSVAPKRFLREERLKAPAAAKVGDLLKCDVFKVGERVDVVGTMKGRGYAGTIKRHNFHRGPETHGCMNVRDPGSMASKRIGKVIKGKRLGGHYGNTRETAKNLTVMRVDLDRNLLFLKGSVAGPNNGFVQVQTAKTPPVKKAPPQQAKVAAGSKGAPKPEKKK
ncbi:MAG: 50S ribosomal protein L3 [Planctomycetes bacterium]|nr:50S ribosomal protein L3 [Planctomycetota bacterium]